MVNNNQAQHQLSIQGGWNFSSLYKVGSRETIQASTFNAEIFAFTPIHLPYLGVKYNYNLPSSNLRFSTGISFLSMGAMDFFWKGTRWAYLYLTVPLMVGTSFKVSDQVNLAIEGGVEGGASLTNVGDLENAARIGQTRYYAGILLGGEFNYKRMSLGIRGHLGVNNFDRWVFTAIQETMYFRHIGGTVYIGYTFWDSAKAKQKKQLKAVAKKKK